MANTILFYFDDSKKALSTSYGLRNMGYMVKMRKSRLYDDAIVEHAEAVIVAHEVLPELSIRIKSRFKAEGLKIFELDEDSEDENESGELTDEEKEDAALVDGGKDIQIDTNNEKVGKVEDLKTPSLNEVEKVEELKEPELNEVDPISTEPDETLKDLPVEDKSEAQKPPKPFTTTQKKEWLMGKGITVHKNWGNRKIESAFDENWKD